MNKYQEALDRIGRNYYLSQESGEFEHFENLYLENKKTLQELVDKETPLNLPLHHGVYMQCKCEAMSEIHSNYCWNCGQALDWSKDEI